MKMVRVGKSGSAVILGLIFTVFLSISAAGYLSLVMNEYRIMKRYTNMVDAFYLAEAGTEYGIWQLGQIEVGGLYSTTYNINGVPVSVIIDPDDPNNSYDGTSGDDLYTVCGIGNIDDYIGTVTQSVTTTVQKNPPSKVFDYVYFINNWGWFYGSGIIAKGDVRSNGIFSFRSGPRADGHIYAGDRIDVDNAGIKGKGGQADHQHPYSKKVNMPNLSNLSYYETLAHEKSGQIKKGDTVLIDKVYGDDIGETGNVVLIGIPSQPLEITGPVVVRGDVIVKGTVKGQGTIYAGRNIYLADNISYKNTPSSPRPANDDLSTVDQWVEANKDKDIVGFAARESIIMGDYTKTTGSDRWYANYWLFGMGDEDVGKDGVPDTYDEGEGDGQWNSEYEDLDGDGARDYNYNWCSVQTHTAISNFAYLPAGVTKFSQLAVNSINKLEGVFYTNHAFTGRTGYGIHINGAIISKDEAIIYRNTIQMNYDERIHSRYRSDPNWLINLNLPIANEVDVLLWGQK